MGYVNKTYLSTQFKNFADKIAKVFSKIGHTHLKSDITDFPTSMPANGGNAATVGGHTVGVNVPSNAKFTDTTYSKLSEFTDDVGYVKNTDARLTDARNAKDVYAWAKASTKPAYTASEVGLGNVGNFKAVSTVASQGLSNTEKSNARANIGAGTSSFSGSYNDLKNKPTIPSVGNGTVTIKQAGTSKGTFTMNQSGNTTIELTDNNTWRGIQNNLTSNSTTDSLSANQGKVLKGLIDEKTNKEVTVAGNSGISILVAVEPSDGTVGAGSRPDLYTYTILPVYGTEKGTICQGNDSRLSNARPASDVYAWAKAASKPSYTAAEVGAIPTTASCNKNWHWSGQSGQPYWLWGSNDGTNMYVYNPSNFNVANAAAIGGYTFRVKNVGNIGVVSPYKYYQVELGETPKFILGVTSNENPIFDGGTPYGTKATFFVRRWADERYTGTLTNCKIAYLV